MLKKTEITKNIDFDINLNEKQAQEIADELGVRPKDVLEMESRLQYLVQKVLCKVVVVGVSVCHR
jgi:DNA-directed RNA polymerase sigma subunit (sigma70/sigma32)